MTLEELRKARDLSQEEVAAMLGVGQPAVAKLEKRGDMHVSNLRRYIEALGGTLEIAAHFGNESVVVENIGEPTRRRSGAVPKGAALAADGDERGRMKSGCGNKAVHPQ